jgi:hypothetical protein
MGWKKKYFPSLTQVNILFRKIISLRYFGIIREAVKICGFYC